MGRLQRMLHPAESGDQSSAVRIVTSDLTDYANSPRLIKCTPEDGPLEGSYEIIGGATYLGGFFIGRAKDQTDN